MEKDDLIEEYGVRDGMTEKEEEEEEEEGEQKKEEHVKDEIVTPEVVVLIIINSLAFILTKKSLDLRSENLWGGMLQNCQHEVSRITTKVTSHAQNLHGGSIMHQNRYVSVAAT